MKRTFACEEMLVKRPYACEETDGFPESHMRFSHAVNARNVSAASRRKRIRKSPEKRPREAPKVLEDSLWRESATRRPSRPMHARQFNVVKPGIYVAAPFEMRRRRL